MSKAPDKIYVQHAKSMSNGFVGIAWVDKNFNGEPVEYIRKDALLEWIAVHRLLHGGVTWNTLIDKLNEL